MAYDIDYEKVRRLASINCTQEEIAAVLDIPYSSFRYQADHDTILKDAMERGRAAARASLRRLQWRHASGYGPAAVAMTIHLSKHWLGETDRLEIDGSLRVEHGLSASSDAILQGIKPELLEAHEHVELDDLCDRLAQVGLMRMSEPQRQRFFELVAKAGAGESEARPKEPLMLPPPSPENREQPC